MARLRTRKSTVAKTKVAAKPAPTKTKAKSKAKEVNKILLSGLLNKVSADMKELTETQERIELSKDVKHATVLAKRIKENQDKLETEMKECGLDTYSTSKGVGVMETPKTRAANKIDIKKFFKKVSEENFFSTATIPLGKAKDVLAGKELEKVTITGRTAQKPDFLKVTPK